MQSNLKTRLATALLAAALIGGAFHAYAADPNPKSGAMMPGGQHGTMGGGSMMGQGSGNMTGGHGTMGGMMPMMAMMQQMNQMMATCNQMMTSMVQNHGSITPKKGRKLDKQG